MIKNTIRFKSADSDETPVFDVGNWSEAEWHFIGFKYAQTRTLPQPIEEDFADFMQWQELFSDSFFKGIEAGEELNNQRSN